MFHLLYFTLHFFLKEMTNFRISILYIGMYTVNSIKTCLLLFQEGLNIVKTSFEIRDFINVDDDQFTVTFSKFI